MALLRAGLAARDRFERGEAGRRGLAVVAGRLTAALGRLAWPRKANRGNERLAAFLWRHRQEVFLFLRRPGVAATNWRAERALRGAVVNRKVWGGNRTQAGAAVQAALMSVIRTCAQAGRDAVDYLAEVLTSRHAPTLLTPER
jgi:transposase